MRKSVLTGIDKIELIEAPVPEIKNPDDVLKPGGKLVMIGIPEFDRWSFSADLGRRKEITFVNIRRQNNCTHDALQMLADGRVQGSAMITHRFHFNQVAEAFDMVKNYRYGVLKAMIEF